MEKNELAFGQMCQTEGGRIAKKSKHKTRMSPFTCGNVRFSPKGSHSAFLSIQLPRAVNTQALSSAGLLRMVNKAADAVNKMTIKMNESDAVSAGEEQEKVWVVELKGAGKDEERNRKYVICQNTLCQSHFFKSFYI